MTTIRPFNAFGPRQSFRAVIPNIINQILESKDGKINLGLVSPTRDFSFVKRTVDGFVRALNATGIEGRVINLGTGFEISIEDTVKLIAEILNRDVKIVTDENRLRPAKSEVNRLFADNQLANDLLKLPLVEPLAEFKKGLKETCDWFGNPQNRAKYTSTTYKI